MPVYPLNGTAERLEFLVHGGAIHDICGFSVDLKPIDIHGDAEIVQSIVRGEHRRLPDLSFGKLTVAEQCVDVDVLAKILRALCHARSRRKPLTKRACRHVDAGREVHIRMPLQARADMTEGQQFLHGEKSAVRQCRIEPRCNVPLGKNKAVAVRIMRVFRIDTNFLLVEIGEIVR